VPSKSYRVAERYNENNSFATIGPLLLSHQTKNNSVEKREYKNE